MSLYSETPLVAEVLPPDLSEQDARAAVRKARVHWRAANRNAFYFAVDLRRLQDGRAHHALGFDNFGSFAEKTFEDLTPAAAKQLAREGAVALALEAHGRITLDGKTSSRLLPGTTALRALSAVMNNPQYGATDEARMKVMLRVHDRAKRQRPTRPISASTVNAALREIFVLAEPAPAHAIETPPVEPWTYRDGTEPEPETQAVLDRLHDLLDRMDDLVNEPEGDPPSPEDATAVLAYAQARLDTLKARYANGAS